MNPQNSIFWRVLLEAKSRIQSVNNYRNLRDVTWIATEKLSDRGNHEVEVTITPDSIVENRDGPNFVASSTLTFTVDVVVLTSGQDPTSRDPAFRQLDFLLVDIRRALKSDPQFGGLIDDLTSGPVEFGGSPDEPNVGVMTVTFQADVEHDVADLADANTDPLAPAPVEQPESPGDDDDF